MNVRQSPILYQFCDFSVYKSSPCSHTAKCTSTQFSTQQTQQHLTLNVMQAYALPGLSHVTAVTGIDWTVELKINSKMNIQFKSHEKSLQQNEGHWSHIALNRYIYIYIYMYVCMYVCRYVCIHFLSHWSHMNSFTPALPWNLNKT
jgi:hypothetical protein